MAHTIRPARTADGDACRAIIFGILRQYGLEPEPDGQDADLDDLEAHYDGLDSLFVVVVDDTGRIVGTGGLKRYDAGQAEIKKMYLLPEARGQGLGRRLLDTLVGFARAVGYRRIVLESNSNLTEALQLYQRYGFVPVPPEHLSYRCDRAFALDLVAAGA